MASDPSTSAPQKVPEMAQQILPPFERLFTPSASSSKAAGHGPSSSTFEPPGSLPHLRICQQLTLHNGLRFGTIADEIVDKLCPKRRILCRLLELTCFCPDKVTTTWKKN